MQQPRTCYSHVQVGCSLYTARRSEIWQLLTCIALCLLQQGCWVSVQLVGGIRQCTVSLQCSVEAVLSLPASTGFGPFFPPVVLTIRSVCRFSVASRARQAVLLVPCLQQILRALATSAKVLQLAASVLLLLVVSKRRCRLCFCVHADERV